MDEKTFILLPLIFIEGSSSSLIEGTRTQIEDFAYHHNEEINNIYDWETRNLVSLYEKYLFNDYHISNFIYSVDSISYLYVNLYENNNNSKFQMTYDTSNQIKKVRPGKILNNNKIHNFIGNNNSIENASLILLKPSLKKEYLNDLVETIGNKIKNGSFIIDHIALIHPIFEGIHPYVDGNGRIGRLFLSMAFKMLFPKIKLPICLSEAFADDIDKYKKQLKSVQKNNSIDAWNKWIYYFIDRLLFTKRQIKHRIKEIIELYNWVKNSKAFTTKIRKKIVIKFFKYYKINKKLTIKEIQNNNKNVSLVTIYNDWNIIEKILAIKDNGDGYFYFEYLYKILKTKYKT